MKATTPKPEDIKEDIFIKCSQEKVDKLLVSYFDAPHKKIPYGYLVTDAIGPIDMRLEIIFLGSSKGTLVQTKVKLTSSNALSFLTEQVFETWNQQIKKNLQEFLLDLKQEAEDSF